MPCNHELSTLILRKILSSSAAASMAHIAIRRGFCREQERRSPPALGKKLIRDKINHIAATCAVLRGGRKECVPRTRPGQGTATPYRSAEDKQPLTPLGVPYELDLANRCRCGRGRAIEKAINALRAAKYCGQRATCVSHSFALLAHSPRPRRLGRRAEPEAKFFNDFSRACMHARARLGRGGARTTRLKRNGH